MSSDDVNQGLHIERVFTSAERDALDVEYETRDAVIAAADGGVVFEQRNVEVPREWSQLATNVVAQKYFRADSKNGERESSVRQMIARVADTIAAWGRAQNYFDGDASAEAFRAELSHILVTQRACFNSPVWFNVGVEPRPQCSACFINSVDDSMESLLDLAKTEAMLFKHGSGTGTNFSRIRAAGERLSGGGRASGPVSFLRGYDSFAGAIKSGGKSRRSAKMIILDADHPDIMEFIESKSAEEKKAHALIAAGYDGSFGGEAYNSVFFQNANHSVRVTDEFMGAVVDDGSWELKPRADKTMETKTVRAKDVLNAMARAAHQCGDPGIQYDTTINNWHTCPATARIHSSNPCLRRGSRILTDGGWRRVEELEGKQVRLFNGFGFEPGVVWKTGVKPLVRLRTNNGRVIELTADHQVLTENGWVPASECDGLSIPYVLPIDSAGGDSQLPRGITGASGKAYAVPSQKLMETLGFLLGDGNLNPSTRTTNVYYTPGKDSQFIEETVLPILSDIAADPGEDDYKPSALSGGRSGFVFSRSRLYKWLTVNGLSTTRLPERRFPEFVWTSTSKAQCAFLRGLFGANGNVCNAARDAVVLVSTCEAMLRDVQLLLQTNGICSAVRVHQKAQEIEWSNGTYASRESYHLEITHLEDINRFSRLVNFPQQDQSEKLATITSNDLLGATVSASAKRMRMKVVQVEDLGIEDEVYDFRCPTTSLGMVDGLIVHNCCFVGDTLVETSEGRIEIGALAKMHPQQLPLAMSYDLTERKTKFRQITRAWKAGETKKLVRVTTRNGLVSLCTPEHRFYSLGGGMVEAQNLDAGFHLLEVNGINCADEGDTVSSVEHIELDTPVAVFDIEVDETHNFAITCPGNNNSVIVSNSEYMFLDDTACNLASINLRKFQHDDGSLNIKEFKHTVSIMILAQEIIVGNASYPTPKIANNSRIFRTLGLGYANLGAYLMARGDAYDSDGGRHYAAAITALMHGQANKYSAVIASKRGAFAGYAVNRDAMLSVMETHRRFAQGAARDIHNVDNDLSFAVSTVWEDVISLGNAFGYRNSQATVLAPTGCVVPDTLITTSTGIKRISYLGCPDGGQWQDVDFQVATDQGAKKAEKFYVNGRQKTIKVVTEHGPAIEGTPNHRVRALVPGEGYAWRRLDELGDGDVLVSLKGTNLTETDATLKSVNFPKTCGTPIKGMVQPSVMTPDFAYILGFYMGNGNTKTQRHIRFSVATKDADEQAQVLNQCLAGVNLTLSNSDKERTGAVSLNLYSREFVSFLAANDMLKHYSFDAYIPEAVLCSTPSVLAGFISGLMDADGSCSRSGVSLSLTSERLIDEAQIALMTIGVASRKHTYTDRSNAIGNRPIHKLSIARTEDLEAFAESVGFRLARKMDALRSCVGGRTQSTKRYDWEWAILSSVTGLPFGGHHYQRVKIKEAAAELLPKGYFLSRVVDISHGESDTFDLSVPSNVTYQANGFVSHNTIAFMMDCDTTGVEPDIALVKYKNLSGGGQLKIVNGTVAIALENLGYGKKEVSEIVDFIAKHDGIEGAPHIHNEHLAVFDCAFAAPNGTRTISAMGHLKMMAAVQPFLSGAISKTVNMPAESTVEDIERVYIDAWRMGLKAVAIYRDGCKSAQPLNTKSAAAVAVANVENVSEKLTDPPAATRVKLPQERHSVTHKFSIGGHEGYITVGMYDNGRPGEIFLRMSKEGSTISGLGDSVAKAISLALQHGVPMELLVKQFAHTRFEPAGWSDVKEIGYANSIMDYVVRWLDLRFPNGELAAQAKAERATNKPAPVKAAPAQPAYIRADLPPCSECGQMSLVPNGSCLKCTNCGSTSGCS